MISLSLTTLARFPSALAFLSSGYNVFRTFSISSGNCLDIPTCSFQFPGVVSNILFTVAHKCSAQIYLETHKYIQKCTNIFRNAQIFSKRRNKCRNAEINVERKICLCEEANHSNKWRCFVGTVEDNLNVCVHFVYFVVVLLTYLSRKKQKMI